MIAAGLAGALLFGPLSTGTAAEEPPSFHAEVRPLLERSCQGCHQPAKAKGGLDLTSFAALMRGGESGALVSPGAPDASLLIEEVADPDGLGPSMPKDGAPLAAAEVAMLRRWIEAGAKDDSPTDTAPVYTAADPPTYAALPVVAALDVSPDGELVAIGGWHEVLLHHADGSGLAARLIGASDRISSVEFSPDGTRLAVAAGTPGRRGELQVWKVEGPELLLSRFITSDVLHGVSWSPDGALIAFGCADNSLRGVAAKSGEEVLYQGAHGDWVLDTAFSLDGEHLASVSRDRSMKLVEVKTQQFIDNITSITPGALKGGLMSVARHPERDELLVGGADGAPKIYRTFREKKRVIGDDFNLIRDFEPLPGRIFAVAWSPDGARIAAGASAAGGGEVRVYDAMEGTLISRRETPGGVYAIAFAPDGATLFTAGHEGLVRALDVATGAPKLEFAAAPLDGAPSDAGPSEPGPSDPGPPDPGPRDPGPGR